MVSVSEYWKVNSNGNPLHRLKDSEVIVDPNPEIVWTCCRCGASANVEYPIIGDYSGTIKVTKCCKPGCSEPSFDRYSLDLPAGRYCDAHWASSGYRKEGREGFDPADAGERYEDDYESWPRPG